ncbi:bifunctional folylpolyglutamate synthase/dihydrofolate synthase [Leptospira selangorensis]|uniref:Dihydrofolate synthase/folylpolyglutamate synthase n=1 Tax=Leptospira selangorensis TaxID=2484982 RepID=A0A5F2C405_9LEPT|nr:cyanophycin synthetase [Leptospira selangorensis]TGM15388.1 bifunctional folylpolyglutamate synthase/dihydrofolate synthase [Leptospira selangorensis]TGM18663.1 bifunctional folylpolyglutamate synthase/dihydrofolate synthase [Leptospira selangorensis]
MSIPDFLEFGSKLTNLEKTRNFNVFGDYSLDPFRNLVDSHGWRTRKKERLRISVVGTNGKGSVSHFLAVSFSNLGYKTGLYTSPHLFDPKERIRLSPNFNPVNEEDLKEISNILFTQGTAEELSFLSWFEWFTLGAFVLFEKRDIAVQVYEAGLGGRLDATKLADPDILVICAIGEDHKAVLGNTKEAILREKLGIVTERTKIVFALEPKPSLLKILKEFCSEKNLELFLYPSLPEGRSYLDHNREYVKFIVHRLEEIISKNKIGIERTENVVTEPLPLPPGRLEIISDSPFIVFDPAHNPDAIGVTLASLSSAFPGKRFSVLAGFLPDKEGESMAEKLLDYTKTQKSNLYFLDSKEFKLPEGYGSYSIPPEKLSGILKTSEQEEAILVLGSFRLYSYIKT